MWGLPSFTDYEFVDADIRDEEQVQQAMQGVDTVFHLAAITNAPKTFDIPEKTWEVNYDGAMNVFKSAKEAGVNDFVNAVTCSVYGTTDQEIKEGFDADPESPYGEAKLEAEQEMLKQNNNRMSVTGLRLGTVYGWSTGMRFDTVVDKFSLLAATGQALTVSEGAENQKRPYLHVQDSVRSLLFAATELGDEEPYNVVGENSSLQDVVDAVERHFPDVEIEYTKVEHLNQLSYMVSDEKIRDQGFETAYNLEQGVRELADKFSAFL
jgi:UDP-glucose 4-epimerase